MMIKKIAIKSIQELPEDASWEDIQERINFVVWAKVFASSMKARVFPMRR
jgi:hypothetical protein